MSPQQPGPDASRRLRPMLGRLVPLGCLLGLLVLAYAMGWHRNVSLETVVENNAAIDAFIEAHRIAAIMSFVVIYAIAVILAMPAGVLLAVIGGFLFGALICGGGALVCSAFWAAHLFLLAPPGFWGGVPRPLGAPAGKLSGRISPPRLP